MWVKASKGKFNKFIASFPYVLSYGVDETIDGIAVIWYSNTESTLDYDKTVQQRVAYIVTTDAVKKETNEYFVLDDYENELVLDTSEKAQWQHNFLNKKNDKVVQLKDKFEREQNVWEEDQKLN